ncbi:RHS repeat-associated core domain-containing protein [Pseudomonas japonica]|uniref:RHS repeat-associated core domain-containing protein n=1 Tax=Pseudomonas japonica TaxID=256466 RepID=A0A239GQA0_9PSED|nr:RHS repeat-associated core domain-containing protein [Pseudomonas japonica]SNS71406.1 RHS repeat-associated core domain-containing protein [Pseudomonas japonica]
MQTDSPSASRALLLAVDRHASPLLETREGQSRRQVFSPYGRRATAPGEGAALGFNGEYLEPGGVYLLGSHRAYSPALRRFCQPDSLSPFAAGGLNAYAYCLGDPVNRIDPDGRVPLLAIFVVSSVVAAGGFIGAIATEEKIQGLLIAVTVIAGIGALASGGGMMIKRSAAATRARMGRQDSHSMSPEPAAQNVIPLQALRPTSGSDSPPAYRLGTPPAYREDTPPPNYQPSPSSSGIHSEAASNRIGLVSHMQPRSPTGSIASGMSRHGSFGSLGGSSGGGWSSSSSIGRGWMSDGPTSSPPPRVRGRGIRQTP